MFSEYLSFMNPKYACMRRDVHLYEDMYAARPFLNPQPPSTYGFVLPHRRSIKARQRRAARRYVLNHAYHDREQAELVCKTSQKAVITFLQSRFESVDLSAFDTEKGEVLVDSHGRGSLQQSI